jgi:[ribosomal protein S5]-alanine N-acetyltransferase
LFTVKTERLGFIPMTAEAIDAAIMGEKELQAYLGKKVVTGLIESIHIERVFPIRLEKVRNNPENARWYGFVVDGLHNFK